MQSATCRVPEDVGALWSCYRRDHDHRGLLEHYLPIAQYHAHAVFARMPPGTGIDEGDLVGAGVLGLAEAVAAFDPGRGVKFATYAAPRVRGAILDWIREVDLLPRSARLRGRRWTAATAELAQELGRTPTAPEVGKRIGATAGEVDRLILAEQLCHSASQRSLDRRIGQTPTGKDVFGRDMLIDEAGEAGTAIADWVDLCRWLTAGMTRAETMIVRMYWGEELTMREIGQAIGLSESRVSQMAASILARMRAKVTDKAAHELARMGTN
jgi:RNA polymerase sigma factor FliA